jgi:hypothetical protein
MYAFPKIDLPPAAIEAAEEAGQVCLWGVCVRGTRSVVWVGDWCEVCVWVELLELVRVSWCMSIGACGQRLLDGTRCVGGCRWYEVCVREE